MTVQSVIDEQTFRCQARHGRKNVFGHSQESLSIRAEFHLEAGNGTAEWNALVC